MARKRVQGKLFGGVEVTYLGRTGRQLVLFSPLDAVPGAVEDMGKALDTWAARAGGPQPGEGTGDGTEHVEAVRPGTGGVRGGG